MAASDAIYSHTFYDERHQRTAIAARRILDRAFDVLPPVRSAVDVGCGVGTWLADLAQRDVSTIQGYEGSWVDTQHLEIPAPCFAHHDLTAPIAPPATKYDLALSLEVAEHLPESAADTFVDSLTGLSDFVLFSAAIPDQGGRHHINEQWLEYWLERFAARGYVGLDVIRAHIWHDTEIADWYRQNVVLLAARSRLDALDLPAPAETLAPVSLVHPDAYIYKLNRHREQIEKHRTVGGAWKLFRRAVRAQVRGD